MKLHLLGTGGYHPSNHRQTACLALPEVGVVLDAGTAMYRLRDHLATSRLDIFLTHSHLDHVIGLTYLLDVLWQQRVSEVNVYGDAATLAAVGEHLFAPQLFPVKPTFRMQRLEGDVSLAGGGRLTHFPLAHPGGARGLRLDWPGVSLAYVTDTTASPTAPYLAHLHGVDLLVHECYFPDEKAESAALTGHSCAGEVGRVAAAVGARRLVLVHVNPIASQPEIERCVDQARAAFPGAVLGEDNMEIELA